MGDYLQRLNNKALEFRNNAIQGMEEFSMQPLKYSSKATVDFVKDYWDLAAAVLAGYALTDTNDRTLGDYRGPIFIGASLASLFGPDLNSFKDMFRNRVSEEEMPEYAADRIRRNILGGLSLYLWDKGITNVPENVALGNKILAVFFAGGSAVMDLAVRKQRNLEDSQPKQLNLPLEHRVD